MGEKIPVFKNYMLLVGLLEGRSRVASASQSHFPESSQGKF